MKNDDSSHSHLVKKEELPAGVILRDHTVDGIQEYDQRLPKWWLFILFSMIAYAVVYWFITDHKAYSDGAHPKLDSELVAIATQKLSSSIDVTNNDLFWDMSVNPEFVAAGEATFQANCIPCHGKELQGGIGFNLVDSEWVHGGTPAGIYNTVFNGVPEKGMQAWGDILGQKRIAEVVSYVLSKNDADAMKAAASE